MPTRCLVLIIALCCAGCPQPTETDAGVVTWTQAFDTTNTGWLLNAWGSSPSDVYAVGGRADAGVVMRFDGATWQQANVGLSTPLLNWTFGFSASEVFTVGNEGTVLHFDGTRWSRQTTPTTQPLWGVWGAAPNDVWAVGGNGMEPNATLLHYDGSTWTKETALPTLQKQRVGQFLKVWGTSADDVYVVGQRGVVLHRTQGQWREELVGASDDLVSLWGANGVVIAVGGRSNGIVSKWDGTTWTTQNLAPLAGFNGVWTRDGKTAWVVGVEGTIARLNLTTLEPTRERSGTFDDLHNCFGIGSTLFAVGGNLQSANPPTYRGVAIFRPLPESP